MSNLSKRGDLRNAGVLMLPLCFAPVKRDDANGWRAVQALVARIADSLGCIKSAAHALTLSSNATAPVCIACSVYSDFSERGSGSGLRIYRPYFLG
jgi:hypothetical protein